MCIKNKRKDLDIKKLLMAGYELTESDNSKYEFYVNLKGPKDSLYEGGIWKVHVLLPDNYPYKSPSIGFENKIYHPNIDESSGSVCLDVINQTWSPLFDLVNIFNIFLPQLLLYPNPDDPLNSEAAKMFIKTPQKYQDKVKYYVKTYAKDENYIPDNKGDVKDKEDIKNNQEDQKEGKEDKDDECDGDGEGSVLSKPSLSDISDSEKE